MKLTEYSGQKTVTNMTAVNIGISDDPTDQLLILNVLSNSLYTDKVTAVWREYGCNAYDANVEAGKGSTPIEITLPNKLAPEAKIRDFGYGMTDEQVLQVFCKLGRSTKRGSNELVGMLGIGSKAGFAYGDNFTVTSWAKGLKTIYTCFRDQGVPRLSKMHEEKTSQPEGVEVKVPVRLQDIPDFCTKAERVFRFFKVRPVIHGGTISYIPRGNPSFKGTGWAYIGDETDSYAIMGNIGYAIAESALPASFGPKRKTLLELGCELSFDIGELEIAANREGLQFRDQTLKALSAKMDTMVAEISKVFTDQISKASCLWEAKKLYAAAFDKSGQSSYSTRSLKDVIGTQITWGGKPLTSGHISVENKESDPEVGVTGYTRRGWGRRKMQKVDRPDEVWAVDATLLVINDLPSKKVSPSRIKYWFEQNTGTETIIVFTFFSSTAQKRFFGKRQLDGAPTINFSAMPKPPPTVGVVSSSVSAHRSKHAASVFKLRSTGVATSFAYSSADSQYWDLETVDLQNDSGVYVQLDRFCAVTPTHNIAPHTLQEQITELKSAGLLVDGLFGFKEKKLAKVKSNTNWTPLQAHLDSQTQTLLAAAAAKQELADYLHARAHQALVDPVHVQLFPKGSVMRDYLEEILRMLKPAKNAEAWSIFHTGRCRPWVETPKGLPKPTTDLKSLDKKVFAKYPMLPEWDQYRLREKTKSWIAPVIDYVKLIEDNT